MPALFIGHGSPMNALDENNFTREWVKLAQAIPRPKAILCISAHWYADSATAITSALQLETIHDFHGFPQALFAVNYSPKGDISLCKHIVELVSKVTIELNPNYGIDHGAWSVLKHMYPDADIPVLQLSIDSTKTPRWHYELAQQLKPLREEGVLVIASGNIVHNLRMLDWHNPDSGYVWAQTASTKIKNLIIEEKYFELFDYTALGNDVMMAIPTPEHFLPLLYTLGLKEANDEVVFLNNKLVMGALSMTSLKIG